MAQGTAWGLFPAGRAGTATRFKEGSGLCHAVVGMEAEINTLAPWRKEHGCGEVAGQRGICCDIHGLQPGGDQLSNLVREGSNLQTLCGRSEVERFLVPPLQGKNQFLFHPFCIYGLKKERKKITAK